MTKLYDYTVTGADKASIDTLVDGTTVANFAGYDLLEVWIVGRLDDAAAAANFVWTVNNDSSALYDFHIHYAVNATTVGAASLAQTAWAPVIHGSGGTANYPSVLRASFPAPNDTTFFKVGEVSNGLSDGTAANNWTLRYTLGYRSTAAISRMKIAGTGAVKFKVGTRLLIYGA
jgi:hypothetical protein